MVVLRAEMRTKMFCGGQLFQNQKWQWERRDMKRYEEIWRDTRKKRYEAAISLLPKRKDIFNIEL